MKNSIFRGACFLALSAILYTCVQEKAPTLTTEPVTYVTMASANSGGNITDDGSGSILARGVCWAIGRSPLTTDNKTIDGIGSGHYTSSITGLNAGVLYNVRAYATNIAGTSYGNEETFTTDNTINQTGKQIIADHTVVEKFDNIPQYYIDLVKKMWLSYAGESHSIGIRDGLRMLETANPLYANSIVESGTPESYTTSNLRASRATWGDVNNATGWRYDYGEEDWFYTPAAIAQTKAGITYCNTTGPVLSAFGFGWCWDAYIDTPAEFLLYINATKQYINYCATNSYDTQVFFTTGTEDKYIGQDGYEKHLGYEQIRDTVAADPTRILFDYADILCYDDGSETPNTTFYNIYTYPIITSTNLTPTTTGHISNIGATRLAKAMWWMLARMAGWDGN